MYITYDKTCKVKMYIKMYLTYKNKLKLYKGQNVHTVFVHKATEELTLSATLRT